MRQEARGAITFGTVQESPPWEGGRVDSGGRNLTKKGYFLGLAVIFVSSYSQYFASGISLLVGAFCVYGISLATISIVSGAPVLKKALRNTVAAFRIGLASFGVFTVAGSVASFLIVAMLKGLDPGALTVLQKPLPVLDMPHGTAWLMVGASILVVGPCEEYMFRGFVYGGLLSLFGSRHWFFLAFVSSILFAGAHLYYAVVYGVAALIPFVDIVAIGLALAVTYYLSGGNLLIPVLIHGVYDATGFVGVATQPELGVRLRGALLLVSVLVAVLLFLERKRGGGPHGLRSP